MKTIAQNATAKARYSIDKGIEFAHVIPAPIAQFEMAVFNPPQWDEAMYKEGSVIDKMNAIVLTDNCLRNLLDCSVSHPKISSNITSHKKKSWKVLPFHITSKVAGSILYNHISGNTKAASGSNFKIERSCFSKFFRLLCIVALTLVIRYYGNGKLKRNSGLSNFSFSVGK